MKLLDTEEQFFARLGITDDVRVAYRLWRTYYVTTERFARSVCTRTRPDGAALPASDEQREAVDRRQVEQQKVLDREATQRDLSEEALLHGQRIAFGRTFDELAAEDADHA